MLPQVANSQKGQVSGWLDQGGLHQGNETEPDPEEIDQVLSGRHEWRGHSRQENE